MQSSNRRTFAHAAALALTAGLSAALALGFLGAWHPALDSLAHFRAHLAVLLALTALPLLVLRYRAYALLAAAFGLAALSTTLPAGAFGLGRVEAAFPLDQNQPVYKLIQLNLYHSNQTPNEVLSMIARERPDVVTFEEVSPMWDGKLELLRAAYPYQLNCREFFIGVAILSRRPFAGETATRCYDQGSLAVAKIDFAGKVVQVAALHLGWPWPFDQAERIDQVETGLTEIGDTALLGGDFNATPWSASPARVEKIAGMSPFDGIGPTWLPLGLPRALQFAGLQIDHILSKGNIDLRSAKRLAPIGSDHLPVCVEFSLRPKADNSPPAPVTTVLLAPIHSGA